MLDGNTTQDVSPSKNSLFDENLKIVGVDLMLQRSLKLG